MKKNILSLSGILVAGLLFGGCVATQSIDEFAYKYHQGYFYLYIDNE